MLQKDKEHAIGALLRFSLCEVRNPAAATSGGKVISGEDDTPPTSNHSNPSELHQVVVHAATPFMPEEALQKILNQEKRNDQPWIGILEINRSRRFVARDSCNCNGCVRQNCSLSMDCVFLHE